jgi:hypothetical protein
MTPARNPFLTAGQQANVDAVKARFWIYARTYLPPPTREEADRLVAEFIERRNVTVCPPAVVVEPSNAGVKWR